MLIIILIISLIQLGQAVLGIDLPTVVDDFTCLKQNGYHFVITRAYRSIGVVDYNGITNLKNAYSAGLTADVYFFPCLGKVSVTQQVTDFIKAYQGTGYGTVWIDVEENPSSGCGWSTTDFTGNCEFLTQLVDELQRQSQLIGIYASKYYWNMLFGSTTNCNNFTSLPLWYAHYDQDPSFIDYPKYQFGGWTKPAIKQFNGGTTVCDIRVDLNYY